MGGLYKCAYSARTFIMTININLLHISCVIQWWRYSSRPVEPFTIYILLPRFRLSCIACTSHICTQIGIAYILCTVMYNTHKTARAFRLSIAKNSLCICNIFASLHINPFMETDHPYFSQPPTTKHAHNVVCYLYFNIFPILYVMCLSIGCAIPIVVFQSEEVSATYNTFNMLWIAKRIYTDLHNICYTNYSSIQSREKIELENIFIHNTHSHNRAKQ